MTKKLYKCVRHLINATNNWYSIRPPLNSCKCDSLSFNDLQLATIGSIGYWADCTSPTSHRVYLGLSTFPVCHSGKLRFRLGSPDPKNANIPRSKVDHFVRWSDEFTHDADLILFPGGYGTTHTKELVAAACSLLGVAGAPVLGVLSWLSNSWDCLGSATWLPKCFKRGIWLGSSPCKEIRKSTLWCC